MNRIARALDSALNLILLGLAAGIALAAYAAYVGVYPTREACFDAGYSAAVCNEYPFY